MYVWPTNGNTNQWNYVKLTKEQRAMLKASVKYGNIK